MSRIHSTMNIFGTNPKFPPYRWVKNSVRELLSILSQLWCSFGRSWVLFSRPIPEMAPLSCRAHSSARKCFRDLGRIPSQRSHRKGGGSAVSAKVKAGNEKCTRFLVFFGLGFGPIWHSPQRASLRPPAFLESAGRASRAHQVVGSFAVTRVRP